MAAGRRQSAWYLTTNLPAPHPPDAPARPEQSLPVADLAEVVRLYGLRNWVEQNYKQAKRRLGWSQYQVRSDLGIRRQWVLVCCAFSFCWTAATDLIDGGSPPQVASNPNGLDPTAAAAVGRGGIRPTVTWPQALRQVRAWLAPWVWLQRWWQAWSSAPPPPAFQALLDALADGYPLADYGYDSS